MWTKKQVAATIDHAVLKPFATQKDVIEACNLGIEYHVASVCVRPTDVSLAHHILFGSGVKVSAVIGFPHGAHRPETKALEAKLAIADGAEELDMVMNIGQFLSDNYDFAEQDISAVVTEAKLQKVKVKVILETCYLTPAQIAKACQIAEAAGANFVKTSTGFGEGQATPEAVKVMLQTVNNRLGVKASGGIRTFEKAVLYLDLGCQRIGVVSTKAVVDGAPDA